IGSLGSIMPLFALIDPSNSTMMYAFACCHYLLCGAVMPIPFVINTLSIPPMLKDLKQYPNNPKFVSVVWKLERFATECRNQMVLQLAMCLVFGIWFVAQRFSSYQLPIAYIGAVPAYLIGMYILYVEREKSTASATAGSSNMAGERSNRVATSPTSL